MGSQISSGVQWIVDDATGVVTGYRRKVNGNDVDFPYPNAALAALVSGGGNLASAAVASTTGTPGEVRKLSDGPDKGASLTWAIPEGRSTYAWCWQIYPLAAYL